MKLTMGIMAARVKNRLTSVRVKAVSYTHLGDGVDGGHQALHDAELVIQHLGDGGQAVGGAGGVGYERHIRGVLAVVDAHDEHGRIVLGRGAHDHVLGASVNVTLAQLLGQVLAGALANILLSLIHI